MRNNNLAAHEPLLLVGALCLAASAATAAVVSPGELAQVAGNAEPVLEHCDEQVAGKDFIEVFECGDELFEVRPNALDGVGMNVGDGGRFTRVPRADLYNWANTIPTRATGPNGEACNVCHLTETIGGAGDGSGPAGLNVIRDPMHSMSPGSFINRNTPHLFGMAGPQLAAEEMTADLKRIVDKTTKAVCYSGHYQKTARLKTKGVDFGYVVVTGPCPYPQVDIYADGISDDLIVRPFQWKGTDLSIRTFSRGAFHGEMGMDPVELTGDGVDGDFDGVVDEISIADVTAMVVYLAAQPRPTTLIELDDLRDTLVADFGADGLHEADELLLPDLTHAERQEIARGEYIFEYIGCAGCHKPSMKVKNVIFSSPSESPDYRDDVFPAGQPGIDPADAVTFDMTADLPDNIITVGDTVVAHLGVFETDKHGNAIVRMFGDLKRHDMGPRLAENIDEEGTGASVWMTKELWGLGSTAPYLHDGRATTIEEAIIEHGGDAAGEQQKFAALSDDDQNAVLAFLNNLVLFFPAEEEE